MVNPNCPGAVNGMVSPGDRRISDAAVRNRSKQYPTSKAALPATDPDSATSTSVISLASRCCTEQMDELPSSHGRPPRPRCILVGNFGLRQTGRIERTPSAPTVGEIAPDGTSGKARALTIANPCPVLGARNVEEAVQHRPARKTNPEGPATAMRTRQGRYLRLRRPRRRRSVQHCAALRVIPSLVRTRKAQQQ